MSRKSTDYFIIHCSATKPSMDIGFEEINRWHKERGWLQCGYHFIIRRNGVIEDGRTTDAATPPEPQPSLPPSPAHPARSSAASPAPAHPLPANFDMIFLMFYNFCN